MTTPSEKVLNEKGRRCNSMTPLTLLTAVVFLASATFGLYQSTKSILHYFDYPITTSITERTIQLSDYPYVVVCFPELIKNTNLENGDFSEAYTPPYIMYSNPIMDEYPWNTTSLKDYIEQLEFSNVTLNLDRHGKRFYQKITGPGRRIYSSIFGLCLYFYPWKKEDIYLGFQMITKEKGDVHLRFVKNLEEMHHVSVTFEEELQYHFIYLKQAKKFRLDIKQVTQLAANGHTCRTDDGYFQAKCFENCIAEDLLRNKKIVCGVPWTDDVIKAPICDTKDGYTNYSHTVKLLHYTQLKYDVCQNKCPKACTNKVYTLYGIPLQDPAAANETSIEISINPNVKIVTEFAAYEFMNMVGDVGGIIGILLGFSVFGLHQMMVEYVQGRLSRKTSPQ